MTNTEKILAEFDEIRFVTEKVLICPVCNTAYICKSYGINLSCKNKGCEGVVEPPSVRYKREVELFLTSKINQAIAEYGERVVKVEEKYQELIMAVEKKYEGETRHETALKYIRSKVNYHHTNQQCYNGACYIHHPGQLGAAGDKNKDT